MHGSSMDSMRAAFFMLPHRIEMFTVDRIAGIHHILGKGDIQCGE